MNTEEFHDLWSDIIKRRGMRQVWGREEVLSWVWWGNKRQEAHWEDLGVDWKMIELHGTEFRGDILMLLRMRSVIGLL